MARVPFVSSAAASNSDHDAKVASFMRVRGWWIKTRANLAARAVADKMFYAARCCSEFKVVELRNVSESFAGIIFGTHTTRMDSSHIKRIMFISVETHAQRLTKVLSKETNAMILFYAMKIIRRISTFRCVIGEGKFREGYLKDVRDFQK